MNIAMFSDCYLPIKNGVVTVIDQMKQDLEKVGHKVVIVTISFPGYEDTNIKKEDIFRVPSFAVGLGTEQMFGMVPMKKVLEFLKSHKVDMIHSHSEFSLGNAAVKAAKKLKIPHVHTFHTMWEDYRHYVLNGILLPRWLVRGILSRYMKKTQAVIAPSIKARNYVDMLAPGHKIQHIPNGINESNFKSVPITQADNLNLRKELGIAESDKVMIFVGRLGKEKRIRELFETAKTVIGKDERFKAIFVGDGPDLKILKKKAAKAGLSDKFIFTGFIPWVRVYRLYSLSDMFVTLSMSEVHPMTVIEAMMCSLPVICRRDDANLDTVIDGKTGWHVDKDEEAVERILELLGDEKKRKGFGNASFQLSKNFHALRQVKTAEKFYARIRELYPDKIQNFQPLPND